MRMAFRLGEPGSVSDRSTSRLRSLTLPARHSSRLRSVRGLARNPRANAQQELAARYIERSQFGAAEGAVGDGVLGRFHKVKQLAGRRNDVDTGPRIERLAAAATAVEAGGHIEIPLRVHTHAVAAAAGVEVVDEPLAGHAAIGLKIESPNAAGAVFPAVGVDQVENL